jgi:excisionase family DNA binding protein
VNDPVHVPAIGTDVEGPMLSAVEIAELFNVHPSTIRRLAREGRIPSYRVGTAPRFVADEVAQAFRIDVAPRSTANRAPTRPGDRQSPPRPLELSRLRAELFGS